MNRSPSSVEVFKEGDKILCIESKEDRWYKEGLVLEVVGEPFSIHQNNHPSDLWYFVGKSELKAVRGADFKRINTHLACMNLTL